MSLLMSLTTRMSHRHIQRTLATWPQEQDHHHLGLVLLPQGLVQEISPSIQTLLQDPEVLLLPTCHPTPMLPQDREDLLLTCQLTQMPPRHIGGPQTCHPTQTLPRDPEALLPLPTWPLIQMLLLYLEDLRQLVPDLVQCQTLKLLLLLPMPRDEHHHQHMRQELAQGGCQILKAGHHLIRMQLPRSRVLAHQECVRRPMAK